MSVDRVHAGIVGDDRTIVAIATATGRGALALRAGINRADPAPEISSVT